MPPLIHFENVDIFQRDLLVLKEVSLSVSNGEFVYLIGKTGSGKSSLLKTMYAELPVQGGLAFVAGYSLVELKRSEVPHLRRKLGIVFQDFQLLNDRSVTDNLLFVMKATGWSDKKLMNERAEEVLQSVGLSTKGYKMPHQLSGGEQQRVSIARALINNPEIILADEPTGNLDPETSAGIMVLLRDISLTGRSVLMATHNYNLIKRFPSRVFRIENGLVIDDPIESYEGSPENDHDS
ncbi:MAG: ATP-binding cassette domain-containing protein [Bacteroidales bacterium]|jgi:cell division transport system ATP-binding protein|nr:ATP-binding cassette domain-containing protein [Bacteroidales bacterium]MDD3663725.1 ATP-binding cassette domain-containing protein [Bacteroidales bacterium]